MAAQQLPNAAGDPTQPSATTQQAKKAPVPGQGAATSPTLPNAPTVQPLAPLGPTTPTPSPANPIPTTMAPMPSIPAGTPSIAQPLTNPTVSGVGTISAPVTPPTPISDAPPTDVGGSLVPNAPTVSAPTVSPLANPDASQLANGVSEYGRMWKPGQAPPPGLDATGLDAWQHNNPTNIGYAPSVWSALNSIQGVDQNTDAGQAAITQAFAPFYNGTAQTVAPTTLPLDTSGYKALEGGQTFTDPTQAQAAKDAVDAQLTANPTGSALLSSLMPGGTFTPDAAAQVAQGQPSAPAPSSSSLAPPTSGPTASPSGIGASVGTTAAPTNSGNAGSTPSTNNPTLDALLNGSTQGPASGVNLTPTDPSNSLLGQTISGPNVTDPVQQALAGWNTFRQATDPAYQASIRDAIRGAAAGGSLGSGALNTSIGDLASNRANALDTARQSLLENALNTQNENAYRNTGITQQQQEFQRGLQGDAVQQALAELGIGDTGNPASTDELLASIFGGNASAASNALGGLIQNTTQNNAAKNDPTLALLLSLMGSGSGTPASSDPLAGIYAAGIPGISMTPSY